ncbi:MAG: DUF760 domain-containing protein [Pseudanabaenaceae cyanobacterium SKYGB_i_bin29]|nr:DUF760 domain-containing protein [Pseudanabaenaceae cyanobacterium SKYG29]MDW8422131.1 DUF760 domain-containing protein [Pseudanabaenaceae cyanobacterium SKYGB_i_bin29]
MFDHTDPNVQNPLLAYLRQQSPETLEAIARSVSPEVRQIIAQNVQNMLGVLPEQHFHVSISTDRENLAGMLGSAMMTGYFLSQMETRMKLDRCLQATADHDS